MSDDGRWRTVRRDADGVSVRRADGVRGSVWTLAAAIVAVTVALVIGLRRLWREETPAVPPSPHLASAAPPRSHGGEGADADRGAAPFGDRAPQRATFEIRRRSATEPAAEAAPRRAPTTAPAARQRDDSAAADGGGASDSAAAGAEDGSAAAEPPLTGIQLFPAPGTSPPLPGIIVPDDFALPEGYVRHYQATDDGKMLPAILMFHPDYEFIDGDGNPIPVPPDRVVPPELAPPGLKIEILEVPKVDLDGEFDF